MVHSRMMKKKLHKDMQAQVKNNSVIYLLKNISTMQRVPNRKAVYLKSSIPIVKTYKYTMPTKNSTSK